METSTRLPRAAPPVGEVARIGLVVGYHIRRLFATTSRHASNSGKSLPVLCWG
jgi:hypothetical protein